MFLNNHMSVFSNPVGPHNILRRCFWRAGAVVQHSLPPSLHPPSGIKPWKNTSRLSHRCEPGTATSPHYLPSRTESIGSTPDVSTTWSWSANRIAFSKHSRPCLVRKSTKASRSSLSTRSAGIWVHCEVNGCKAYFNKVFPGVDVIL